MAYKSLEGIKKGKVTKDGQPVPQPFRYELDKPKKAKLPSQRTGYNV